MNATMTSPPIAGLSREDALPGDAMIGQVYLRVADLDRAIHFYRGALGFKVVFYGLDAGLPVVFLATGNYRTSRCAEDFGRHRWRVFPRRAHPAASSCHPLSRRALSSKCSGAGDEPRLFG